MSTNLTCGNYEIYLDSFHTYKTYAGLLAGIPNAELNAGRIAGALRHANRLWGCRSPHLIPPVITKCDYGWRPIDDNNSDTSSRATVQPSPLTKTEHQALAEQSAPDDPVPRRVVEWARSRTGEMLPPDINFAKLQGPPINPDYCASELVLIWFAKNELDMPLGSIVADAIRDLKWAELAEDYDF